MVTTKFNSIVIQIPEKMTLEKSLKNGKKKVEVNSLTKTGNLSTRNKNKAVKLVAGQSLKVLDKGLSVRSDAEEKRLKELGDREKKRKAERTKENKELGKLLGKWTKEERDRSDEYKKWEKERNERIEKDPKFRKEVLKEQERRQKEEKKNKKVSYLSTFQHQVPVYGFEKAYKKKKIEQRGELFL